MNHNDPTLWPLGTSVRVLKLAACDDAHYQTCSWNNWKVGEVNEGSPPVDYELQGLLIGPLEIGRSIVVAHTHRNNIKAAGTFVSTPVREFKKGAAITMNSIYFISRDDSPLN